MTRSPLKLDSQSVDWEEMRTAYLVGELHTVSRTAQHLGVHRTTVMRHITSLEKRMGRRVFVRERNGCYPTEFGKELITVARRVAQDLQSFFLTRGAIPTPIEGRINIAAPGYLVCFIASALAQIQEQHPNLFFVFSSIPGQDIDFDEDVDLVFTLRDPSIQGHTVQKLMVLKEGLFASSVYIEKYGEPHSLEELRYHKFVSDDVNTMNGGSETWLRKHIAARNIVFRSSSQFALYSAIEQGIGIGLMPIPIGRNEADLVQVLEPSAVWGRQAWVSVRRKRRDDQKIQNILSAFQRYL